VDFWGKTSKWVFGLVVLSSYPAAADWTMYLGDPAHSSYLPAETELNPSNLSQLQQLWRLNIGAPIASGVTAFNGTLYFGAWDGYLYSVNSATGDVIWKVFLGVAPAPKEADCQPSIGVTAQPVVSGDAVYAGGGDSAVYALDRSSGHILWRTPLADPQSGAYLWPSLLLDHGAIYIGIASLGDCPLVRGGVARISLNNPSHPLVRYLVPEGALGAGIWSTPAMDEQNSLLYVTTGNADVQDAASGIGGAPCWRSMPQRWRFAPGSLSRLRISIPIAIGVLRQRCFRLLMATNTLRLTARMGSCTC